MALVSKILLAAFGMVVLAVVLSIFAAGKRWESNSRSLAVRFEAAPPAPAFDPDALPADLPAPVTRFFRRTLPAGSRAPAQVHITETGTFRAGVERGWRDFSAEHHVGLQPPGFVWSAKVGMAPLIHVRVRDAYVEGSASMEVKILAVIGVLNLRGRPELNTAALQRYLAEGIWYPWALLPGGHVSWAAMDSVTARAALTDGNTTASLVFHFDPEGDVVRITGERARWAKGSFEVTPWEVRVSGHESVGGVRVPKTAEVLWHLPEGEFAYYRGTAASLDFETDASVP